MQSFLMLALCLLACTMQATKEAASSAAHQQCTKHPRFGYLVCDSKPLPEADALKIAEERCQRNHKALLQHGFTPSIAIRVYQDCLKNCRALYARAAFTELATFNPVGKIK